MKPVTVTTTVPSPREEVYDFLDSMPNHERFCDHFLLDWSFSGPRRGVGAHARARTNTSPTVKDWVEIEVIEAERPLRIVERNVGAEGARVARGTYLLEELPDGAGTKVSFEFATLEAPRQERVIGPLIRAWLRRNNGRALKRLAGLLASEDAGATEP